MSMSYKYESLKGLVLVSKGPNGWAKKDSDWNTCRRLPALESLAGAHVALEKVVIRIALLPGGEFAVMEKKRGVAKAHSVIFLTRDELNEMVKEWNALDASVTNELNCMLEGLAFLDEFNSVVVEPVSPMSTVAARELPPKEMAEIYLQYARFKSDKKVFKRLVAEEVAARLSGAR